MKPQPDQIESLRNLGPKSAEMLRAAGISSLTQLRRIGAVKAFMKVRAVDGRASLNLLWALEAALTDRHWRDVAKNDRLRLLLDVEDCQRSTWTSGKPKKVLR